MTYPLNKVVPMAQDGHGTIKQVALKAFAGSNNSEGGTYGGRASAALLGEAGSSVGLSSDDLEESTGVQQLVESAGFQGALAEDSGFSLLHYVALLGQTTLAEATKVDTPAARRRFARIARYLLKRQDDDLWQRDDNILRINDQYGCIPLQLAAAYGNKEMVEVLLEPYGGGEAAGGVALDREKEKARSHYLNHQDAQIRFTALHGAVNHDQHDVAVLLLRNGANPQILDITRNNAFQVAPSLESLQELLNWVVRDIDAVPTPAIAQLMIEVIKQQEEREKADRAKTATVANPGKEEEEAKGKADWSKLVTSGTMDYTQRMIFTAINKLVTGQTHGSAHEGHKAAEKEAPAVPPAEAGGAVGGIIKRLFKELYEKEKHTELWHYVQAAVDYNNYKLTKMMLDLICKECPRALASCNWDTTMESLIACFPDLFHALLYKLQDMSDLAVVGFVQSLRLSTPPPAASNSKSNRRSNPGTAAASPPPSSPTLLQRQQQEQPQQHQQLQQMTRRRLPSQVVSNGSAAQGKILIYQQLVEGLKAVNYVVVKAFFEKAHQEVLNDMALYPIFENFVMLIADKRTAEGFTESDSSRERLLAMLRDSKLEGPAVVVDPRDTRPAAVSPNSSLTDGNSHIASKLIHQFSVRLRASVRTTASRGSWCQLLGKGAGGGSARGIDGASSGGASGKEERAASGDPRLSSTGDGTDGRQSSSESSELAVQTLNVSRVLRAAVHAGKSMNVEATVRSITSWVNLNSKDRRAVFITGISTELLKDLSRRFPLGCAKLLNLVSRDVLEQLVTLQVAAKLLLRKDQLVKCSTVRNHFTWRAPEMQHLADEKGFSERVVDALVDYGIPFECTYKAAFDGNATREDFAALIEEKFTGDEIRVLISNDIKLPAVVDIIRVCKYPPSEVEADNFKADSMTDLIRDMIKEKLSFRIVEAIQEARTMNEATTYINFRPGNLLYNNYKKELYYPCYTKHFIQLLLTNWRKGVKSGSTWTQRPWDKKFIDTIFAPNDPLCTALKSAYDNKLKDTQVYIDKQQEVDSWARKQRQDQKLVLSAFVCRPFLLHRWPVFFLMHLLLYLKDSTRVLWRRMGWEWGTSAKQHSVDARALVIPWKGIADMGSVRGMLTGLIDVDVPVRWFGFAAVKAAITVQWQEFGQMLMLMSALAHVIFMALYGGFLLVLRHAGVEEEGQTDKIHQRPEVMALLIVLGLMSFGGLLEEASQMMELTWRTWRNYLGNIVDVTSFALFVVLFGMVWSSYRYDVILAVGAVETLVLFIRLVFFASMTDSMGSLMRMVIEIIKDMRYFFTLLGMIFSGFAIAFAVLLGPSNSYEAVAFKLFSVMLGDWQYDYLLDMMHTEDMWYVSRLSVLLMSVYGILMLIVLVNLLIAIMNDTYDRIKETEEIEVLHNRARLIVDLESLLTKEMRDKLQERLLGDYLHVLVPADNKFNKFMASSETGEGDWKGRMRAFSEAMKRDVEPRIRGLQERQEGEFRAIRSELDYIKKWVVQQKRVMGELSESPPPERSDGPQPTPRPGRAGGGAANAGRGK